MYSELHNHSDYSLLHDLVNGGSSGLEGLPLSSDKRRERPNIVTVDEDRATPRGLFGLYSEEETDNSISAPDRYPDSSYAPSSFSQGDFSMSPAAMFLSGFTPSVVVEQLPDSEGQGVSGYTLGPIIGHGGFSTIRKATSSSGGVVAIKIVRCLDLDKQENPALVRKRLDHEAAVWSSLNHEHILPLFSAEHTSYADYFVTLYCPAGSLFDILTRDGTPALPQDDVGMMFRQVVRGLRYLHETAEIVHRDIKLENVLVDEMGVCRIGDFGMSRRIGELDEDEENLADLSRPTLKHSKRQANAGLQVHLSLIRHQNGPRHRSSVPNTSSSPTPPSHPAHVFQPGSLPYASPELLLPHTSSAPLRPHPAQDIWALGVLLYTLLTSRFPFNDTFEPRLQMKILHGVYDVPVDIGKGAERVLQGCLERSVPSRWTIAMVDEVAWGVGWGSEGDVSHDTEELPVQQKRPQSISRSGSLVATEQSCQKDAIVRPSLDTARRRSSSRVKRSLSRAPALSDRTTSTKSSSSRSISRPSRPSAPCLSALTNSILSSSSSSSESLPSSRDSDDSALATSPPPSHGRGRGRRLKKEHSRSPSPSLAPMTPVDFDVDHTQFHALRTHSEEGVERDTSRGRRSFMTGVRTPRSNILFASPSKDRGDLDVLEETTQWASGASIAAQWRKDALDLENAFVGGRSSRAGSVPPTPSSSTGDALLSRGRAQLTAAPRQKQARSQSVEY